MYMYNVAFFINKSCKSLAAKCSAVERWCKTYSREAGFEHKLKNQIYDTMHTKTRKRIIVSTHKTETLISRKFSSKQGQTLQDKSGSQQIA